MKKVGDLLTALGAVGLIAVVLELIIGWKMITIEMSFFFIVGSLILLLIGIIFRSIGKSKSDKNSKSNE